LFVGGGQHLVLSDIVALPAQEILARCKHSFGRLFSAANLLSAGMTRPAAGAAKSLFTRFLP